MASGALCFAVMTWAAGSNSFSPDHRPGFAAGAVPPWPPPPASRTNGELRQRLAQERFPVLLVEFSRTLSCAGTHPAHRDPVANDRPLPRRQPIGPDP